MKGNASIIFAFVCIAAILCAGCMESAPAGTPVTEDRTPAASLTITKVPRTMEPAVVENTTAPTQAATDTSATENTTGTVNVCATIPPRDADPILHRYVFRWPDMVNNAIYGYEYKFYPEGSVIYKYGIVTEVSSNLKINPTQQMAGTWTNIGNCTYLVKILPEGESGQYYTREYILIPDYEDPLYPGKIYREHIESNYERDAIFPGYEKTDRMYFPERAKID
ncbi:MAG: hypothetical protein M0Q92_06630 [Methanoregula sp.]|nr:hypothetical protein [Methanoregula sp.]